MSEGDFTNVEFSRQCSFILKKAANWAEEVIADAEKVNSEANRAAVYRFTDEVRERLALIDEWAGRGPRDELAQIEKLQKALAYWMPGISEELEIETNGRAGDDACLLYGYTGELEESYWDAKAKKEAKHGE